MSIKYLKGIYGDTKPKTTRPTGLEFPLGLSVSSSVQTANGANTAVAETFDVLVAAGGGGGGGSCRTCSYNQPRPGGGGGGGGLRIFSANSFNELVELKNPLFTTEITNFIPVIVGGGGGNSCFGNILNCRGGTGGQGANGNPSLGPGNFFTQGRPGNPGGSGGGGGGGAPNGSAGNGIEGQGNNGANGPGSGGSALVAGSTTGLTSVITGTNVQYSGGGCTTNSVAGTASRGQGGTGASGTIHPSIQVVAPGGAGGSGIVAIRYRNPAAPTTPLATGGECVCCTGDCIIHIFNSSGFLNVQSTFSIN